MNQKLVFFSNFLKRPKEVAAIASSSNYVIKNIIKNVDFSKAKCIVEYGPGMGTVTKPLLKNLGHHARLICFEPNLEFCSFLKKNIKDPRLLVVNDNAERFGMYLKKFNIKNVDYVFSGIPFSLIKRENKSRIIKNTKSCLRKGGKFIIYQQYNSHLKNYLGLHFRKISRTFELRNIPPTFIFICEKT